MGGGSTALLYNQVLSWICWLTTENKTCAFIFVQILVVRKGILFPIDCHAKFIIKII